MPPHTSSTTRLYNRDLVLAVACQTCFVVANTLLAQYGRWIEFLGGNVRQVGWIMGSSAVVVLVARPWLGQWTNRLGSRTMWYIGYAIFVVGCAGNLLLDGLHPSIYFYRALLVLGGATVFASSLTYVTQTAPPNRRTEAIGILGVGGFLGMLIGPALGDVFLSGDDRTRSDFLWMFKFAAISVIVPVILLSFLRTPAVQNGKSRVSLKDFVHTAWKYWPGTVLWVAFAFGVCMAGPFVFLASFIDEKSLAIPGVSVIGLFFWCYAGWGLIVRVALRQTPDRRGRRKVLLAGLLILAAGNCLYGLVSAANPWLIIVPALVAGTGHGLVYHTMTSLTLESYPTDVRGTGAAVSLMAIDLGFLVGSPVLGSIADGMGFDWMFASIGLVTFLAAAIYAYSSIPVWQQRREQRRELDLTREQPELLPAYSVDTEEKAMATAGSEGRR